MTQTWTKKDHPEVYDRRLGWAAEGILFLVALAAVASLPLVLP